MSNEMKGFLTTLDLVTQNKIEPETVVEEDEIEETLTINEDGVLLSEATNAELTAQIAELQAQLGGSYVDGVLTTPSGEVYDNVKPEQFHMDQHHNNIVYEPGMPPGWKDGIYVDGEGRVFNAPKDKPWTWTGEYHRPGVDENPVLATEDVDIVSEAPNRWRWNPHVQADPDFAGRDAEQDEIGMDEFHADAARQRQRDKVASNMRDDGDDGREEQAVVQDFHPRFRPPSSRNYKTGAHSDIELKPDGSDWRPTDPKVGSYMDEPGAKSTWDKLADVPDWYLRSLEDAYGSAWRGVKDTANTIGKIPIDAAKTIGRHMAGEYKGVADYGKRIGKDFRQNVLNGMTIEDATILLEDYESMVEAYKKGRPRRKGGGRRRIDDLMSSQEHDEENSLQELTDIRRLSGLEEAVGDSAKPLYDLQDELDLEDNILVDELARYLNVDQIADFVENFRRHHGMGETEPAADEKTELVYDENGDVHKIRPSEVDVFLQGHPGRGLAESA